MLLFFFSVVVAVVQTPVGFYSQYSVYCCYFYRDYADTYVCVCVCVFLFYLLIIKKEKKMGGGQK